MTAYASTKVVEAELESARMSCKWTLYAADWSNSEGG